MIRNGSSGSSGGGNGAYTSPSKNDRTKKEYKRQKYLDEQEEEGLDFIAHRPKYSSHLKTSSTVLHDDELDGSKELTRISTDEDDGSTEDDEGSLRGSREVGVGMDDPMLMMVGGSTLLSPRALHGVHGDVGMLGSVGSPGVPGRPILHTTRPSPQHGHTRVRKTRSGDGLKQTVFGKEKSSHLVDTGTQTAANASTQTSDTEMSDGDGPIRSASPEYPKPVLQVNSIEAHSPQFARDTRDSRHIRSVHNQDGVHRRSVSWDPPSLMAQLGGDPKNPKNMVMLSQILKEKREQLLQRELEIKKEKERQELRQHQERQLQQERQEQQRQQELRQQEQLRHQEQLRQQEQLRLQEQQLRQQEMRQQEPGRLNPHRRRESMTKLVAVPASNTLAPTPPAHHVSLSPQPTPSHPHHTQALHVSAHHHRSKSDPNVIPILLRGLHSPASRGAAGGSSYTSSTQLASALAAMNAAAAAQGMHIPPSPSGGLRTRSTQESSPRTSSSLSSRKTLNTPTSMSASTSPTSPIMSDKQKELLDLEKRIEAKQRQLLDKGFSVAPFTPREERRRDWSSILELQDDALLTSLEDIEEEIEQIKQRTIDIQGKVQLLERCVAPDPLTMMFGDHGTKKHASKRISPYNPASGSPYVIDPPTFASPHNDSPFKRLSKHQPTSPTYHDHSMPPPSSPSFSSFSSFSPSFSAPSYHRDTVRPTMSRYSAAPSPVPTAPSPVPMAMGPDMSKRMNLGPRASAFSPPPPTHEDPTTWSHSARSAFSPPPRGNSQEDMQIHWTRL